MSSRRPLRVVVAVALAAASLLTLAGCRVQPGAAAFVGTTRISESDVARYVSSTAPAASAASPGTLPPRAQVVATLVVTQVLRDYLAAVKDPATGQGVPTSAELAANRDQAFSVVTGQTLPDVGALTAAIAKLGFQRDFATAYIDQIEVEYVVIQRSGARSLAALGAAVAAKTPTVRVSPRYGAWDPSQLSLAGATTTPSYLQLTADSAA